MGGQNSRCCWSGKADAAAAALGGRSWAGLLVAIMGKEKCSRTGGGSHGCCCCWACVLPAVVKVREREEERENRDGSHGFAR